MKSLNIYSKPIEEKFLVPAKGGPGKGLKIIGREALGHRKFGEFDLSNALDFICDIESPIRAALDGEVFDIQDNVIKNYSGEKVPSEKLMSETEQDGNFVVLKHENYEYSIYSHIKPGNIIVEIGYKVKTGDLIALSGETGWSIEPHLHFMVFELLGKTPDEGLRSHKIRWK